jgi:RNA polymerase sigma-70 factor (ECF subfamily)
MMTPSTPFTAFLPFALPHRPPAPPPRPTFGVPETAALLNELAPRIARVVRAVMGGGHPDVDDVQQQALLAFVQALPSFRGECEPRYFASRIAARTALQAARRARAARARRDDAVEVDELLSSEAQPHEDIMQRHRQEVLRDLLATIPQEQAETLVLRVVLGWSLPDVASATGVPLNTVRSRVRLAKNALRRAIDEDPRMADELRERALGRPAGEEPEPESRPAP